jgi:predicted phosphodiesterase
MRLLILSDLHHELWREQAPVIDPAASRPDVVILAGDIDRGGNAVAWAERVFAGIPVLYVHGNHESYGENLEDAQQTIQAACLASKNVHFLNRGEYRRGGIRFLGATLWTDFRLFGDERRAACMSAAETVLMDYKRIDVDGPAGRKLTPEDTTQIHAQDKAWLTQQLAAPFAGTTVVITHMAPSLMSVAAQYAADPVSAAFASRLDDMVGRADLWIHGHMHDSYDYRIGACRVVCNPCGYRTRAGTAENPQFDPAFIVELD